MKQLMAWKESARYYDLIYSWKDYRQEADRLKVLITRYKKSPGRDLLEVACGTGGHARYLRNHFSILATDNNPEMLRIARRKIPGVRFKQADMLHLELSKQYDVVLCLFGSIGYLKTRAELRKAIGNFARHMKAGSVVIIEPWLTRSSFKPGTVYAGIFGNGGVKIARFTFSKLRGQTSIVEMHHLVAKQNEGVKYFVEGHELRMFERNHCVKLLEENHLKATYLRSGFQSDRGLLIGIKI